MATRKRQGQANAENEIMSLSFQCVISLSNASDGISLSRNHAVVLGSAPAGRGELRLAAHSLTFEIVSPFGNFPRRRGSARGAPNCSQAAALPNIRLHGYG